MYTITLPTFEGPLDLLLHLIEAAELDITTIALAQVADQYLAHVRTLNDPDPAAMAEFVALAARLLLIKSRALLPPPTPALPEADPSDDQHDDAEALLQQLRDYRRYKETAALLRSWQAQGRQTFLRTGTAPLPDTLPVALLNHSPADLLSAVQRCLQRTPTTPTEEAATPTAALPLPRRLTVAEVMHDMQERLSRAHWITFDDLLPARTTRQEIVVTFWAVLELLKRRVVVVEQAYLFAPITIGRGSGTPAAQQQDAEHTKGETLWHV